MSRWLLLVLALTACKDPQVRRLERACLRRLALARTAADTDAVLLWKPADNLYSGCAYWLPEVRPVVDAQGTKE